MKDQVLDFHWKEVISQLRDHREISSPATCTVVSDAPHAKARGGGCYSLLLLECHFFSLKSQSMI